MRLARWRLLGLCLLLAGCSDGRPAPSDGCPGPCRSDRGLDRGLREGPPAGGAEAGTCSAGALKPVGRLCVRGPAASPQQLTAGQPVRLVVYPKGCFSSSCTTRHQTSCSATAVADVVQVSALFCLEATSLPGQGCTADCSGGGFAECQSAALLAGSYTATVGGISVPFTVPGTLPSVGGACQGDPF